VFLHEMLGEGTQITKEMVAESFQYLASQQHGHPVPGVYPVPDGSRGPSLFRKAWNYLKALALHVVSGFDHADLLTLYRRRKTCNACPQRDADADSCRVCGCGLQGTIIGDKLRWKSSSCPEKRW